jgi:hypothetical protein
LGLTQDVRRGRELGVYVVSQTVICIASYGESSTTTDDNDRPGDGS